MASSDFESVTVLLSKASNGDALATDELYSMVQNELRTLAQKHLSRERTDHSLQPTVLVNDVFLKLVGKVDIDWESRRHFFRCAYASMRNLLIDHARKRRAQRRGGGEVNRVAVEPDMLAGTPQYEELLDLNEALERLRETRPRQADVVEIYQIYGNTMAETAELLNISESTVKSDWKSAQDWLRRALKKN